MIKKSRFIALVAPIQTRDDAKRQVASAHAEFPDARHVCWAYLLGNPQTTSTAASNDAGEPSGTAGRPILNVIQHKGIGDVIVIVVRYFGGIKLGAGGLVRAYSGAADKVLSEATIVKKEPQVEARLYLPFAEEQYVRHLVESFGGQIRDSSYDEQVSLRVRLASRHLAQLLENCAVRNIRLEQE